MKLTIVSSVFPPEPVVSARTSGDLACELVKQGHNVQVVTAFPNRPAGKLYDGYQQKLWVNEQSASGFGILRLFAFFSPRSNMLSRFLENISFGIASAIAVFVMSKPDVIYANTWPLFAQGSLVLACRLRRIPLVLSIQDLYPESLFIQKRGFVNNSLPYRFLRWLDVQIARNCSSLIVISEQFKQTYICDREIPENKINVIPNWIDDAQSIPFSSNDIRKKHNIPEDAFLVMYGGNIGVAAGMEQLIEAFQQLRHEENIYLLIAGAGSRLSTCLELIHKYQLEQIKVHSPWSTEDTWPVLQAADLCIVPTQGEQSLASIPSKLLTYMMAGRSVLAIALPQSETTRVVTASDAGWSISEFNPEIIAKYIHQISMLPTNERDRHGQSGYRFVQSHFSINANLSRIVDVLLEQHESKVHNLKRNTSFSWRTRGD